MPSKGSKHVQSFPRSEERVFMPEYGAMSAHDSALANASDSTLSFRCQPIHCAPGTAISGQ